jgi:hypothetical protein
MFYVLRQIRGSKRRETNWQKKMAPTAVEAILPETNLV